MIKKLSVVIVGTTLIALGMAGKAQAVTFQKGDVFAGVGNGYIKEFDSAGNLKATLDTGVRGTEDTGMAFDSSGDLYATLFGGKIVKFDTNGNLLGTFGSGFSEPESIVFDKSGNVYVGQAGGSTNVLKFNPSGNLLATYSPAIENRGTDWLDLAADQKTLRYTSEGKSIKAFDLSTNTQLPDFTTALTGTKAFAHRILSDGGELVADSQTLKRLDATGQIIQTYTPPISGTSELFALNLDPDGKSFWTADYNTGDVYKFDISTGSLLQSFNAGILGISLAGLVVDGEIVQAVPTPTPSPTPVPEPSIMVGLLAFSVLGAGVALKRKRLVKASI